MNRSLYALALIIVFSQPSVADEMSNVKVVKAMTEAINDRNLDALDAFISPNLVRHSAATPGLNVTSLDEFRAFLETDFATIPDSVQTIDAMAAPKSGHSIGYFGDDLSGCVRPSTASVRRSPPQQATSKAEIGHKQSFNKLYCSTKL